MFIELETNILSKLAEILPDHSRLPYGIEIEQNKLGKATKGFAVLILSSQVSDAQMVGRLTLSTKIEIRLSDTFGPEKHSDSGRLTASHTLSDRCLSVFKELAAAKLNTDSVRNVTLSDISDPIYVDGEKTVYRTLTIEANLKV
jgi:hypothetical protein